MALTPGLRSFREDAPSGSGARGRAAQHDEGRRLLQSQRLKPQAAPVDTFHRPQQAPIDNNLNALADALASLNPALKNFGSTIQDDRDQQEDAAAKAIAGKSSTEINEMLKSGQYPELNTKFGSAYVGKLQSASFGDADAIALRKAYEEEFDKNNGDLPKFIDDWVGKRTVELGGPGAASGYLERMVGVKTSLLEHHQKWKTEETLARQQQTVQDGILSNIRNVIDTGASDTQAVQAVGDIMRTNKLLLNKPYKEQQAWVLSAVEELSKDMERNPEKRHKIYSVIETLLEDEREDEQGVKRRLTTQPGGVGEAATKVLADAKRSYYKLNDEHGYAREADVWNLATYEPHKFTPEILEKASKENPGLFTAQKKASILHAWEGARMKQAAAVAELEAERAEGDAEAQHVAQQYDRFQKGELHSVEDATLPDKNAFLKGTETTRKVSADQVKEQVFQTVKNQLQSERNHLLAKGQSERDVDQFIRQKEMTLYAANGMAPPAWKRELKSAMVSITNAVQTSKALPPETIDAFEKYRTIKHQHSNLLKDIADEDTRKFFDVADVAAEMGHDTPEQQLSVAATYFAKDRDENAEAVTRKDIAAKLTSLTESSWFGLRKAAGFGESLQNPGALAPRISEQAAIYVKAFKMPVEQAIEVATKNIRNRYAVVNGWAVETNNKNLGPNFERNAEKWLDLIYSAHKDRLGLSSKDDLVVTQMANSEGFHVFNQRTGRIIPNDIELDFGNGQKLNAAYLTTKALGAVNNLLREKDVVKAVRREEEARAPIVLRKDAPPGHQIVIKSRRTREIENQERDRKATEEGRKRMLETNAALRRANDTLRRSFGGNPETDGEGMAAIRTNFRKNLGINKSKK